MKVKCPKCRLLFEMPIAPGVKELSCVCERCGSPFLFQVPEGYLEKPIKSTQVSQNTVTSSNETLTTNCSQQQKTENQSITSILIKKVDHDDYEKKNINNKINKTNLKNGSIHNLNVFNAYDKKKQFYILFLIITITLSSIAVYYSDYLKENTSQTKGFSKIITEKESKESKIDSTKYYLGKESNKLLFVKGLKRGALFDSSIENSKADLYTYKCGSIYTISIFFDTQITVCPMFIVKNEDDISDSLPYDFGEIGEDPTTFFYEGHYDVYPDNQYIVGQSDLDDDGLDELILAVRTVDDGLSDRGDNYHNSLGIAINVLKLENGEWNLYAKLVGHTNVLPANAKIVKNSIYIRWLRYDEKYTLEGNAFVIDSSFYGRAFVKSDFE